MRAYLKKTGKNLDLPGNFVTGLPKGRQTIVVRNTNLKVGSRTKWDGGQVEFEVVVTRKNQMVHVCPYEYPDIAHAGLIWKVHNLRYETRFLGHRLEVSEREGLGFHMSFLGDSHWIEFPEKPLVRPLLAEAVDWAMATARELHDQLSEFEWTQANPKGIRSRFDIMEELHVSE